MSGDNSGYTGKFTQNEGSTTVTGKFFTGESVISDSVLNYLSSTDLSNTAKLTLGQNSTLNIGNTDLGLKNIFINCIFIFFR